MLVLYLIVTSATCVPPGGRTQIVIEDARLISGVGLAAKLVGWKFFLVAIRRPNHAKVLVTRALEHGYQLSKFQFEGQ